MSDNKYEPPIFVWRYHGRTVWETTLFPLAWAMIPLRGVKRTQHVPRWKRAFYWPLKVS